MPTGPKREPDFQQFLKVLRREGKPRYLPIYEYGATHSFIENWTGIDLGRVPYGSEEYWRVQVRFWRDLGSDSMPLEIPLNCPLPQAKTSAVSRGSEAQVVIRSMEDFEKYPWPDESHPIDFQHFETVARLLPEGMKIAGGVQCGPYEWAATMLGVVGLSMALADDPELVALVFRKLGALHCSAVRQLATLEGIGALRQGDDLGYKTSTFLSPDLLRRYVFPTYKTMVAEAHRNGKPFVLHSCGNLAEVYDDLINFCHIDAKHSFEDTILPVHEFKRRYGKRVTPLGGLDVDFLCRAGKEEIRRYTRRAIEQCFDDGYWAFGTGNCLTSYLPVENYLAALEQAAAVQTT